MLLHDSVADAQAQARAFTDGLGGEERIENVLGRFDARSAVGELDEELAVGVRGANQTYNSWFADASINRTFGRAINASVGYHLQSQSTGVVACSTGTCPASVTENVIYLELGWRPRPFTF